LINQLYFAALLKAMQIYMFGIAIVACSRAIPDNIIWSCSFWARADFRVHAWHNNADGEIVWVRIQWSMNDLVIISCTVMSHFSILLTLLVSVIVTTAYCLPQCMYVCMYC